MLEQMLDLNRHIIGELRKLAAQSFNQRNCVAHAIEKIRVSERDMLRAGRDLLTHIAKDNFTVHDTEDPVVHRNNRAMTAEMFTSTAGFGVPHGAMLAGRKYEMSIAAKLREIAAVRC